MTDGGGLSLPPSDETVRRLSVCGKSQMGAGDGDTPSHFDRLRWWGGKGAVEAKCEGGERSWVARWSWHGGGKGLPGMSSQDGALLTPLRTHQSLKERAPGALSTPPRTQKGHGSRQAGGNGLA